MSLAAQTQSLGAQSGARSLLTFATTKVVSLPVEGTLGEAAEVMSRQHISSIVILDAGERPVGILTERNILRAMQSGHDPETPVEQVMSAPVVTVNASTDETQAYRLCLQENIRHLVVVNDEGRLAGVLSETDFRLHMQLEVIAGHRQVASVMSRTVLALPPEAELGLALNLMHAQKDSCVVVVDGAIPVGILTERDVVRFYAQKRIDLQAILADVMTTSLVSVTNEASLNQAAQQMLQSATRHLVVVDADGHLAGLVTEHDLTQTLSHEISDALLDNETQLLRILVNTIPDLVWLVDRQGSYRACNAAFERFCGLKEWDILGKTDQDFAGLGLNVHSFGQGGRDWETEGLLETQEVLRFANGYEGTFDILRTPMRDRQKNWVGVLNIARDITERCKAEDWQRLTASVITNAREGILVTDADVRIVEVNQSFVRITGYEREDVLGKKPSLLRSGHQDEAFYAEMWKVLTEQDFWSGEVWNRRKDGEVYVERLTISVVRDRRGEISHYAGIFADITPVKENEQRLERIAYYDALTGVPNRNLLADRMDQALAQTRRASTMMAVCYMDLDGFKLINDSYGHGAGDQLLVEMTRRVSACMRGGDSLVRLGGDEFVLLMLGFSQAYECERSIRRLLDVIAQPVLIESRNLVVTASLGVTLYPKDKGTPETLLRHADQALYQAKRDGKNGYAFYERVI